MDFCRNATTGDAQDVQFMVKFKFLNFTYKEKQWRQPSLSKP